MTQRLCCDRTTLWRLRRDPIDPIPFVKINAKVLFPVRACEKWLERRQRLSVLGEGGV